MESKNPKDYHSWNNVFIKVCNIQGWKQQDLSKKRTQVGC